MDITDWLRAIDPGRIDDAHFAAATDALWRDNRDHLGEQLDQRTGLGDTAEVVDYLRRARGGVNGYH